MITIRDPVHGSVVIGAAELPIVDSRVFQRLRGIKQLGFTDQAFPGATHTRWLDVDGKRQRCVRHRLLRHPHLRLHANHPPPPAPASADSRERSSAARSRIVCSSEIVGAKPIASRMRVRSGCRTARSSNPAEKAWS